MLVTRNVDGTWTVSWANLDYTEVLGLLEAAKHEVHREYETNGVVSEDSGDG